MSSKIVDFVRSLQLPSVEEESLIKELESNPIVAGSISAEGIDKSSLTTSISMVARKVLASRGVVTEPLDKVELDTNWSRACSRAPAGILLPSSTSDVSRILKIVTFFKQKLAVRSGGHSPNPGWSSIDDVGVLLDLSRLNQIDVSADKKTVSLGTGGRWGDVYAALDPHGVSVIGGRIPQVGVGGLILGGGFYHFSGEYGLAVDNVKNFEIVLADGSIKNANASENSDLFWALKGGGPNFRIVTRFDLYTIPVHDIWYQVALYTTEQVPTILDASAEWQENSALDAKSTVALIVGLEVTTVGLIYSAPAEKPAAFSPFYDIPAQTIAVPPTNGTVLSLTNILGSTFSNVPQRHDYRGAASKIDAQLYKDLYAHWREQALAANKATGINQTFTLQLVPINLVEQGIAKGGNALGLPKVNHQWWTTLVDWKEANDDATVRAVSISTGEKWKQLSEARDLAVDFLFMNDASRDQSPLSRYGEANVARLKDVSRKYDPLQIFQNLQNDGFLLRKV